MNEDEIPAIVKSTFGSTTTSFPYVSKQVCPDIWYPAEILHSNYINYQKSNNNEMPGPKQIFSLWDRELDGRKRKWGEDEVIRTKEL